MENETPVSAPDWHAMLKLIGFSADWVWELDRDFRFTGMSGTDISGTHGLSRDSLIGKRPWETGLELYGENSWESHKALLSAAKTYRNVLFQRRSPNGSILYAHISGMPYFDSNNDFAGYRGIGLDVTQAQLDREEHQWFRAVVDTSPSPITITDIETQHFLYANKAAYTPRGMCLEDYLETAPHDLVGITKKEAASLYKKIIAAGDNGMTSQPMLLADNEGRRRAFFELNRRANHINGRWLLSTITRDVSQMVLAEEALKLVGQMYEARCALEDLLHKASTADDLYVRACTQIAKSGRLAVVSLLLASSDQRSLKMAASFGSGSEQLKDLTIQANTPPSRLNSTDTEHSATDMHSDLISEAFWARQPASTTTFKSDDRVKALRLLINDDKIKSAVAIPLLSLNDRVGVLLLGSTNRRAFGNKAIEIAMRLSQRLSFSIDEISGRQALQEAEDRMRFNASRDTLTGLPNRHLFSEQIRSELLRSKHRASSFAILHIDIDEFSHINQQHGYTFGDEVLSSVAARLKAHIRGNDTITRLGADQFVVLLRDALTPQLAKSCANTLLKALNEPTVIDTETLKVTACIGISMFPSHAKKKGALLRAAKTAATAAKKIGANTIHLTGTN